MVSWLFGKGPDHYTDKLLNGLQTSVTASGEEEERAQESIERAVSKLKTVLYGEEDKAPKPEACARLAVSWIEKDAATVLLHHLRVMGFEVRKDVSLCFTALALNDIAEFRSKYLAERPQICRDLARAYTDPDTALAVGPMLRSLADEVSLQRCMLRGIPGEDPPPARLPKAAPAAAPSSPSAKDDAAAAGGGAQSPAVPPAEPVPGIGAVLLELMRVHVHAPQFEVSADAFQSLQTLLTCNKEEVRSFLLENHDAFFDEFGAMMDRANFSTLRQSLKLLGELLLDRSNFEVMVRYVADRNHLRRIMMMLRDRREAVQIEAFHVFKVFVANPEKPPTIVEVLLANREKLVKFLRALGNDKDDKEFAEEKALLIDTIENRLELPEGYTPSIPAHLLQKK